MKTIRDFHFPLLVLLGSLSIVLFTSYGNKKAHPDLNSMMVDAFLKRNNKGDFSQDDFKKYTFFFEAGTKLKGTTVVKDGFFSDMDLEAASWGFGTNLSSEGPAEMTPKEWISTGGYSADVPEVPASLRHFYDPTRDSGDRYLTDITNAKIMGSLQKYVLTNPRIDGVEWALGKPGDISEGVQDHKYTWEHGKIWMQMALREPKQDKRNKYMAGAWRALGETLHMIADNGCPPHVRNDAHPSPIWNNNTWFGNADPYEELIDVIRRDNSEEFEGFAKGSANSDLVQKFGNSKKASDIAHALAVFTNTNFVTNETISGLDKNGEAKKQITHPDIAYTSPLLEAMTYNDTDNGYYFAGSKQCTDRYYFGWIPKICEPFVDMECVKSQARILFPNIIEAGANVIKLYIPKLTVEIKSLDKGILTGEIKHKTDQEYTTEIRYNGPVTITIRDKKFKVIAKEEIIAINGKFESKNIKADKEQKVVASIFFGGIGIESNEFKNGDSGILGFYEGAFTMKSNESAILETARIDMIDGNRLKPQEDIESGLRYRQEEIQRFDNNFQSLVDKGWATMVLSIYNVGTPPRPTASIREENEVFTGMLFKQFDIDDKEYLPDSKLEINEQGFTSVISTKSWPYNHITTQVFTGVLMGEEMNGSWSVSRDGLQLYSGEFKLRKIGSNN